MRFVEVLFWLFFFHALLDYQLQLDPLATMKDPDYPDGVNIAEWDRQKFGPWWWSMGAHGILNGGGVALATGRIDLGIAESVVHFCLDTAKCKGWITTNQDQFGHVVSKLIWGYLSVL